ncbi:hypothetical protein SLEP1_g54804, partial [Rubroshorea leprosula]
ATFPCLEELELKNNDITKEIWHGQYPGDYFPKLKVLKPIQLPEQSVVQPFLFQSPNLEKLVVSEASFLELFQCQGLGDKAKPALALTESSELRLSELLESVFYNLKTLEVLQCSNLKNLVPSFVSFKNLTTLEVSACHELINLIEYSTAKSMVQLTKMSISKCQMLKEIVACVGEEVKDGIAFIQLKYLLLRGLPRLASFCSGNCGFELTSLEEVIVMGCPNMHIFSRGECSTTNKLQKVKLTLDEDEGFWEGNLNSTIKRMFTEKARCYGLEDLKLFEFPELIEIWYKKPQENLPFKRLKFLEVSSEQRPETPTQPFFSEKVVLPNLEELQLRWMNVNIKWHPSITHLCVEKLKKLIIQGCDNLEYLFSSSIARGLVMLGLVEIRECKRMREIIVTDNAEEKENLIFPQLNFLLLKDLRNIVGFYSGNCIVEFPSLKQLQVLNCPELEGFIVKYFASTNITDDKQPFFNEQVAFPSLESLTLTHLKNLNIIWHNQFHADSFGKLKSLTIENCEKLSTVFPSADMLGRIWKSLEKLILSFCGSLEVVFGIVEFNVKQTHAIIDTKLRELNIYAIPKLKYVWNKDPQGILTFHSLESIEVQHCGRLQILFPASIGKSLSQLQKLHLWRCGVEEIVTIGEQGIEAIVNFELPRVSSLELGGLPRLQCFYPGQHTTAWPMLKKFYFSCFNQVKRTDGSWQLDFPVQLSLFSIEKLTSQLEELSLTRHDITVICEHQFKEDLSFNIKVLQIRDYLDNESDVLPIKFLQRFCHLEDLVVNCCNFKELFPSKGEVEEQEKDIEIETLSRIKTLNLTILPHLKHIWSHDSSIVLQNLGTLRVFRCESLISLTTSPASFQNLVTLNIISCGAMCPKLMIFNEGDLDTPLLQRVELIEGEDKWRWEGDLNTTIQRMYMEEVGFAGLQHLMLSNFPKLLETWHIKNPQELLDFRQLQVLEICDCSKFSHSLELPQLSDFIVKDCPKMVTCAASTSSEEHDKEDYQYLLSSKVETPNLEFLSLSSNNIQQILDNSILEISSFVQNLRKLCVEGCGNLEYLLTSSMVKSFEQLNWLKICDCNMMEEVIHVEESMDEERMCKIFFPNLEFLLLQDLPKLTRFCSGNYLELPCLWKLKISKCPVLKTFISSFFFGDMIASSENVKNTCTLSLFDAKVAFPKLERLVIEHVKSLNKIWNNQLEVDSFCQLTLVSVVSCEKLLNIFPFSMLKRLQRLDKLQIWNCDSLEEILESHEPGVSQSQAQKATPLPLLETVTCLEDDVKDKIVFSKLKYLQLCGLPRLSSFCSVKCKFEFPFLEDVILMDCPSMQTFSMDEIRTPKVQKVKLTRDEDEGFWDGNLNSTIQLQFM